MRFQLHIFVVNIGLLLGCDRLDGLDEGDRNTSTWRGVLVQDCNGEPIKNRSIYLEASYSGVPVGKTELIAEGKTDKDGQFSITYRKLMGGVENVGFYVENGQYSNLPILTSPANQDVYRNIALNDCYAIQLNIKNVSNSDSIYLLLGKQINSEYRTYITVDGYKYSLISIKLPPDGFNNQLYFEMFIAGSWNNVPSEHEFLRTSSLATMREAIEINLEEPDTNNPYSEVFQISGYPKLDTLNVEF